ncbi:type IX secretion system sortase PorU [Croceibacter atlanticus]|uniref:type IX secretion system sortase PorU n=1 Tax=Croceibacter atlanticus TaxID=313588 RepID=UPI002E122BA6|nr:type IX secretion system sortase PorU [Croceibacter atlanticus]
MKISLFFTFLLFTVVVTAQSKQFSIVWEDEKAVATSRSSFTVPGFETKNFEFDDVLKTIHYSTQWKESGYISQNSVSLSNVSYQTINKTLLSNLDTSKIPTNHNPELKISYARGIGYATLRLSPIIKDKNTYKRLTSFTVNYTNNPSLQRATNNTQSQAVTNSVLASGNIYKFYVEKDGVHQLTRSFLQDLGMNVNNIDPRRLKIYGHGGRALPLLVSENEHFDPPQVSIQVIGEEDGSFDNNDSVLFYAESIYGFVEENNSNINPYAERAYYYITADGDLGNRIFPFTQPTGTPDVTFTTFDDYKFVEEDRFSPVLVGRRWFGDRFDVENDRTYEFDFPNIVNSEQMLVKVYAAAASESSTTLNVNINGEDVDNLFFGAIAGTSLGSANQFVGSVDATSDNVSVNLNYNNNGNPASRGYLDYISIEARRELIADNIQFKFKNRDAISSSGIGEYIIQNSQNISQVWDITNAQQVTSIANTTNANTLSFKTTLGEERNYVAISPTDYYTPLRESQTQVINQNLKGTIFNSNTANFEDVDYLMLVDNTLISEANRLAQYRRDRDGLNVKVVQLQTIYNEFSSGQQDISAIRNFVKYVYDNASSPASRLKYVCLFGEGSVDYKDRLQNNNLIIPTYQRLRSFSLLSSFASDDYFGMIDPNEGTFQNFDKLDIAIGRILADTPQLARTLVDKIIDYESKVSYGRWRNNFLLISDDVDVEFEYEGIEVQLDALGDEIGQNKPSLNVYKIHSDAFQQESTAGGNRYPDVNEAITNAIERGATLTNYFGHGGEDGLANEFIVTQPGINNWANTNRYTMFVTVTCEFTKFDNPLRIAAGELTLQNPIGGSVAMITTTREITVVNGVDFNAILAPFLFDYDGNDDSVAEALRKTKNEINNNGKRVVFYLGDPAMKLSNPKPNVRLTHINDTPISQPTDTLKALSYVKMRGQVTTPSGGLLNNYTGNLEVTIFDKRIQRTTLGNDNVRDDDGQLLLLDFTTLGNTIFRGQASVTNGEFEFDFIVPQDIGIPVGNGRISFYAEKEGELDDQSGFNEQILVGGINENAPEDNEPPIINLFMNDESFVSGDITNSSPFILAKLEDLNGINTASGIGHDITAVLDGEEIDPIILNDYYEAEVDDYSKGEVVYRLRGLEEGLHTLTFTAWDTYNNKSTADIQFIVTGDDELAITRVLNYPNPFTDYTEFWFKHNRPFEPLEVQVQVMTVSGKVVWTTNQIVNTGVSELSRDITWDGRDDFGDRIGKGVYIYKLSVKSTVTNKSFSKFEKLVIL